MKTKFTIDDYIKDKGVNREYRIELEILYVVLTCITMLLLFAIIILFVIDPLDFSITIILFIAIIFAVFTLLSNYSYQNYLKEIEITDDLRKKCLNDYENYLIENKELELSKKKENIKLEKAKKGDLISK